MAEPIVAHYYLVQFQSNDSGAWDTVAIFPDTNPGRLEAFEFVSKRKRETFGKYRIIHRQDREVVLP